MVITNISNLKELSQTGLDANASSVTTGLDIGGAKTAIFQVLAASGTHATHVITLQESVDNSNWDDVSGATVAGAGVKTGISVGAHFVRLKVTTLEGGASTVDVTIQAK